MRGSRGKGRSEIRGSGAGVKLHDGLDIGIVGNHVQIEHTEDIVTRVISILGVFVAAPETLLLPGEGDEADGMVEIVLT